MNEDITTLLRELQIFAELTNVNFDANKTYEGNYEIIKTQKYTIADLKTAIGQGYQKPKTWFADLALEKTYCLFEELKETHLYNTN